VAAWLQRHIESGPSRPVPRFYEGSDLGMGQAHSVMGTLPHHLTRFVYNDGANPRVGMSPMGCGELDGSSHVAGIAHSAARH
jgi:hypothetical protein